MTADELRGTLGGEEPPAGLPLLVEALWWQAHGDWQRAHGMVDALKSADGAWVHAYLHRVEGVWAMPGIGIGRRGGRCVR